MERGEREGRGGKRREGGEGREEEGGRGGEGRERYFKTVLRGMQGESFRRWNVEGREEGGMKDKEIRSWEDREVACIAIAQSKTSSMPGVQVGCE